MDDFVLCSTVGMTMNEWIFGHCNYFGAFDMVYPVLYPGFLNRHECVYSLDMPLTNCHNLSASTHAPLSAN